MNVQATEVQASWPGPDRARNRDRHAAARVGEPPRPSARSVGRRIIRIGARLAAEPSLERLGPAEGPGQLPRQEITPVTIVAHELKASYAFIERNFNLTRRYWGWEVAFLVYSVAGALSITLIGADQGSDDAAADPDDRGDLLELPVGRVQLDRRDDLGRTLGGHPRVHDDGAGPALVAAARFGHLRHGLRPHPHRGDLRRAGAVLPAARPLARERGDGRRVHAARLVQLRRDRDDRRDPAAAVRGARGADDVRPAVVPAARQRRLLLDRDPARVDAGAVAAVAGHVRPRRASGPD